VEQAAPAGEGRGGGAVPTWGRAGAVQGPRDDGWGGLNQRGGGAQWGEGRRGQAAGAEGRRVQMGAG
jgi:hypothetical protein